MFAPAISLVKTDYSTQQTLLVFRKFLRGVPCNSDVDDYKSDRIWSHILKVRTTLLLLVDSHVNFSSQKTVKKLAKFFWKVTIVILYVPRIPLGSFEISSFLGILFLRIVFLFLFQDCWHVFLCSVQKKDDKTNHFLWPNRIRGILWLLRFSAWWII